METPDPEALPPAADDQPGAGGTPVGPEPGLAGAVRARLRGAEHLVESQTHALEGAVVPAWRRVTQGEPRWPVSLGILGAIAVQVALPDHLAPHSPLVAAHTRGLRDLYRLAEPADAAAHLDWWLAWACRSRIPAFITLSKTVRANRERVLAAVELGLSNSKLEGLKSKIRLINHRG